MYIEEIIVEGFKSYATRTVISGFDPSFNAITGLNGSGKSNILDAICFVLGITNLSQVRVSTLQELVYKQGQAGVNKASVTIVFNNENTKQSPVGYEQYKKITITRQVVIGGRNKYLINGINANNNRVQNLFHSVQLNVNNPHFLIMQGRITRVINMKPMEILAMIEEAAGTRMYEMKKQSALKTIQKKDKKVEEITRVLEQEITPTLENLRQERTQYTKWTNNQTEIERLSRFTIAYEYSRSQELLTTSAADLEKMEEEQESLRERSKEISARLNYLKKKITELSESKEKEMESDFKKMESNVNKLSKEFVKCNSEWEFMKEACDTERQRIQELEDNSNEVKENIQQKKKELEDKKGAVSKYEEKVSKLQAQVDDFQRKYQAASVGMSADEEGEKTLTNRLMDAKREAVNAATEAKQAHLKIKHLTSELKEHKKLVQSAGKEYTELQSEITTANKELAQLKKSLDSMNYNETRESELVSLKKKEESIVEELRTNVDTLSAQLSGLSFVYSDPEANFDRSKVKGLVANLLSVKDSNSTMALEVVAGGKLYNVVVDTEVTSKQLINKGKLRRRVTIIPLNKINAKTIDPKVVKLAEKLVGSENVQTALSLVSYDKEVTNAMKYVFGNTFVCQDSASAKAVTFNSEIRTRSVTLEGDIFDPAGTLTGGSRAASSSVLGQLQTLNDAKGELMIHEEKLSEITKELTDLRSSSDKYKSQKQKFQLKSHETEILQQRLAQNPHHQVLEKVKEIETQLEKENSNLETTKQREEKAHKDAETLEHQMKNFSNYRETQMKEIETQLSSAKSKYNSSSKELKGKQQEIETISLEIDELKSELEGLKGQIKEAQSNLTSLEKQYKQKEKEVIEKRTLFETAEQQLETKRASLVAKDKSISELVSERDSINKELTDNDIESKKIEHKIVRYHKDKKDAAKFVEHLEQKYSWIKSEKHVFGKANTDYDWKAHNPNEAQKELTKLQEEQSKLSKSINKKVMSMYEKAEQEYKDLVEKKRIIENDKSTIESFIKELDDKKNEALQATWVKVNRDFGSIFSTLLPGTTAKLEPPEGKDVLQGLEMRVAFGDVWKESLSELSGGQRSLLALSLILSLLLFKPAPMYILDEIDAALDLNHTQNIGQMLKTHFSHSQFIVVSLKEDMFKNANVLFQTKFVDGVSTVTRTAAKKDKKNKN